MNERSQTSTLNLFGSTSVQPSTSTTETTKTTRLNIQLDSSLQGYLRAASKLTRNLEKANHHTQLLHTALITNKPPRGLIPKITPRIPETSTEFIIKWENTLQETANTLTKHLKEFWADRATEVQKQLDTLLPVIQEKCTEAQWNQIQTILQQVARETSQDLKRKKPNSQPRQYKRRTGTSGNQPNPSTS